MLQFEAHQLGPSIRLLLVLGVPAERLATLFHTTSANIRQIKHRTEIARRASRENLHHFPDVRDSLDVFGPKERWKSAHIEDKSRGKYSFEERTEEVEQLVARYRKSLEFENGANALRRFLPFTARASEPVVLDAKASLHFHIAWFLTHTGHSESALEHARTSMSASLAAFNESFGNLHYLRRYGETALVASNSLLLAHNPTAALSVLKAAQSAAEACGAQIGSEVFRQRGTALLQLGQDDLAEGQFSEAREAMRQTGEARNEEHVITLGTRQTNFVRPAKGCEAGQELIARVVTMFGESSLQYVMAVNWAAATALRTDSPSAIRATLEKLEQLDTESSVFKHQATISRLLPLVPRLNLLPDARTRFLRFLLYENAHRKK